MKVKEKPLTIGDRTFESFEEFYQYVMQRQVSKEEAIKRVKQRLAEFEQKYGMTSEEFYRTIAGTPAEDEVDFIEWKMEYQTYLELIAED
jgi:replication initiation and membrane attachment protein DnaB